jgi:large subunit ribosomal protein L32
MRQRSATSVPRLRVVAGAPMAAFKARSDRALLHCPPSPGCAAGDTASPRRISMAVQQNKKSPSKRGMHRSHNAVAAPGTAVESTTGEVHLRHHISPTGFYRGRKVLKTKADA